MQSEESSKSTPSASPQPKPDTSLVSEMLMPSEIEQLRRVQNEQIDYALKEFSKKEA